MRPWLSRWEEACLCPAHWRCGWKGAQTGTSCSMSPGAAQSCSGWGQIRASLLPDAFVQKSACLRFTQLPGWIEESAQRCCLYSMSEIHWKNQRSKQSHIISWLKILARTAHFSDKVFIAVGEIWTLLDKGDQSLLLFKCHVRFSAKGLRQSSASDFKECRIWEASHMKESASLTENVYAWIKCSKLHGRRSIADSIRVLAITRNSYIFVIRRIWLIFSGLIQFSDIDHNDCQTNKINTKILHVLKAAVISVTGSHCDLQ